MVVLTLFFFGSKDRSYFILKGWIDKNGEPQKPKLCKFHREERKKKLQELRNAR